MRIYVIQLILFTMICGFARSQDVSSAERKLLVAIDESSSSLPKDLLSTKTLVVISIYDPVNPQIRGDWQAVVNEAHRYIAKLGIDPVQYIYIDDLNAGYDVKRAITNQMIRREIKNILLLSKDIIKNREQYIGVVTSFSLRPTFITGNQPAWKSQTSDLEILFRNLARSIDQSKLVAENLLIMDTPEFFRSSEIISGRRYETFNTDLRIDRLAVPVFDEIPQGDASNSSLDEILTRENAFNQAGNSQLELILARYPYQYQLIQYDYDEKKLASRGFQYVLMRITTSGNEAKRLLGYLPEKSAKEFMTYKKTFDGQQEIVQIPADALIHKYYIKHINSGEIYLGEQWDADVTWEEALTNHLQALIEKLGLKK